MVEPTNFGYFTVALIATGALLSGAGIQYLFLGMRAGADRTYLPFSALCGCVSVLAFGSAVVYATTSLASAILVMHVLGDTAALILVVLPIFVGRYTGRPMNRHVLGMLWLFVLVIFVDDLTAPYSSFFSLVSEGPRLILPWGESLFTPVRTISTVGTMFSVANLLVFGWTSYSAIRQTLDGQRLRGGLLLFCLFVVILTGAWSSLMRAVFDIRSPPMDLFGFPLFVLLMSLSLAEQMHRRRVQLEQTADELRNEIDVRKRAEFELRHIAYHDALTGLPNRLRALYILTDLLAEARQCSMHGAVLMVDLDNFKTINDSLGHHVGDQVLESIGDVLLALAPPASTVARLGGDEFIMLLDASETSANGAAIHAMEVAEGVLQRLAAPLTIDSRSLGVGASIGVAVFPFGAQDAADVLRCADIALYRAKSAGRNIARQFLPQMQRDADERLELERGLRMAMEQHEFTLHFQPQMDMQGKLVGAEALLRWTHPTLGPVSPATFIPIAEETGLVHAIGAWVVVRTCEHIRKWRALGIDFGGRISVNVSPWQLAHPQFVSNVIAQVVAAGVEPTALTLELTESALLVDFAAAQDTLKQLSSIGFRLSLDDFGTGYSSLSYLQQLPLDELKIDRSFINTLRSDMTDPLASFVIDVGSRLGMTTIAEGVETAEQESVLRELGCDAMQGYLISKPLKADDFQQWAMRLADEGRIVTDAIIPGC
ncbi:MAG TPA: EAL domain-containing protein [Rhodanobacter sp.]|nr:EAL domain-containing protein [Rhodanobacter sp.]